MVDGAGKGWRELDEIQLLDRIKKHCVFGRLPSVTTKF
jgi:hypothetical protein